MEEGASGRFVDAGAAVGGAASTLVVGDQPGDDAAGGAAAPTAGPAAEPAVPPGPAYPLADSAAVTAKVAEEAAAAAACGFGDGEEEVLKGLDHVARLRLLAPVSDPAGGAPVEFPTESSKLFLYIREVSGAYREITSPIPWLIAPPRTGATEGAIRGGAAVRSLTGARNGGQRAAIMIGSRY